MQEIWEAIRVGFCSLSFGGSEASKSVNRMSNAPIAKALRHRSRGAGLQGASSDFYDTVSR